MVKSVHDTLYIATERLDDFQRVNERIHLQFAAACQRSEIRQTHYFEGRYENIYIERDRITALEPVLEVARGGANRFLSQSGADLSVGFWFNEMQPGHITLPHRHDEDGELVSAVYYVKVPEGSGDLVLSNDDNKKVLTPKEGMLVFFRPGVLHEVKENKSNTTRLSIGMNFGIRE